MNKRGHSPIYNYRNCDNISAASSINNYLNNPNYNCFQEITCSADSERSTCNDLFRGYSEQMALDYIKDIGGGRLNEIFESMNGDVSQLPVLFNGFTGGQVIPHGSELVIETSSSGGNLEYSRSPLDTPIAKIEYEASWKDSGPFALVPIKGKTPADINGYLLACIQGTAKCKIVADGREIDFRGENIEVNLAMKRIGINNNDYNINLEDRNLCVDKCAEATMTLAQFIENNCYDFEERCT